jgi:hypothetical protein
MNENIIPITYFKGTGGHFLCHLLVDAKKIYPEDDIKNILTDLGQAHLAFIDFKLRDLHLYETDEEKIKFILNSLPKHNLPPFFFAYHLFDINLVNAYFKKSIRITYDLDDVEDISAIFYNKFFNTPENTFNNGETFQDLMLGTRNSQEFWTKEIDMPNVLFISWKELFEGDIESLISKLSNFTNINNADFSRTSITYWRELTNKCLTKL